MFVVTLYAILLHNYEIPSLNRSSGLAIWKRYRNGCHVVENNISHVGILPEGLKEHWAFAENLGVGGFEAVYSPLLWQNPKDRAYWE